MRAKRFFVYCYEVTPDFVKNFKYPKKDGNGEFRVDYMEAAFDQETKRGEFFVEFVDSVYDNHLVDRFEAQGAKGAYAVTFQNNDGDKSAINALACVLTLQDKTGSKASRGVSSLLADAREKQVEDAKQEELLLKEVSEKDAAAIKKSLEDVNGNFKEVKDGVHSCEVKLESCEVGIVEMKHDVKSHGVVMGDIKNGLCNVIPDLQSKNADLEKEVKLQKSLRDTTEGKLGHKTRLINQQDAYITRLEEEQTVLIGEKHAWGREKKVFIEDRHAWEQEKNVFLSRISILEGELEKSKSFNMLLEKVGHTAEILSSTLAEERAAKRQRE